MNRTKQSLQQQKKLQKPPEQSSGEMQRQEKQQLKVLGNIDNHNSDVKIYEEGDDENQGRGVGQNLKGLSQGGYQSPMKKLKQGYQHYFQQANDLQQTDSFLNHLKEDDDNIATRNQPSIKQDNPNPKLKPTESCQISSFPGNPHITFKQPLNIAQPLPLSSTKTYNQTVQTPIEPIPKQYFTRQNPLQTQTINNPLTLPNKSGQQSNHPQSRVPIRQKSSITSDKWPNMTSRNLKSLSSLDEKEELIFEDEVDLRKEFVIALIIGFLVLHLYYALVYDLEFVTVVNLGLLMLWGVISPKHQVGKDENVKKSLHYSARKLIMRFVRAKNHHLTVNKPIFKLILFNFLAIDLGLFKILIGKLGFASQTIKTSDTLSHFFNNYVDLSFVNILQQVIKTSWQSCLQRFQTLANPSTGQEGTQFILITVFKFLSRVFHWIYLVIVSVGDFVGRFFEEIVLDGRFFMYLVFIVVCCVIAFRDFFAVSRRIQRIIDNQVQKQVEKDDNRQQIEGRVLDNMSQTSMRRKSQPKQLPQQPQPSEPHKKRRKQSTGSSGTDLQPQPLKRSLPSQTPVSLQFSKYLLLSSLLFMYLFSFLAEDGYQFLGTKVTVKQMWVLVLCLYAFLIVENCKRMQVQQRFGGRAREDGYFGVKSYGVGVMVIILIMHDFVRTKLVCEEVIEQRNIVSSVQCLYKHTNYLYYLSNIFYTPHTPHPASPNTTYRLNILAQYLFKLTILLNLRFHKLYLFSTKVSLLPQQPKPQIQRTSLDNPLTESIYTVGSLGVSSTQSYKLRKKVLRLEKSLEHKTYVLLGLTVGVMVLTNAVSNVIVLIGVFLSVPVYKDAFFRRFLMLGVTLSLILQPNQFLYFILLVAMLYVRGQDLQFRMHSHWLVIQVSRMYILFSKVSVINFLMGLGSSAMLVMYSLSFRIVFNYMGWISVFMGTQDNYLKSYFYGFIPHSIIVDLALWIFLFLLKTYTPNLTPKFPNTQITNIFQQYPVIQKLQPLLKIFKIIQLVAYVTIELIVITETPSVIVFVRLLMHLVIAAVDLAYEKVNQTLKNLWKVNLYVSLGVAFLKYFYLLGRYQNLSPWLVTLLEPLERNWSLIGLWQAKGEQSIFSLLIMFLPDICIIFLSMLVQYSLQVKIFQSYRQVFIQHPKPQPQDSNSQQNGHPMHQKQPHHLKIQLNPVQSQIFVVQGPQHREKDIQYLYRNYIKDLEFKFKHSSWLGKVLSDFLYDIYFMLLCVVYFLLQNKSSFSGFWLNLPHFCLAFWLFKHQQDRKLPPKTFNYSIIYSCLTILLIYLKYLYQYVTIEDNQHNTYFYRLSDIVNKYVLFLLGCLFYKLHQALKGHSEIDRLGKNKDRRKNLLFVMLMPAFEKNFTHTYVKEITVLWVNFFKATVLAVFVANCFTSVANLVFNIMMAVYLVLVVQCPVILGYHSQEDSLKHFWVNPFLLSFCFTLWDQQLIGYAGIIFFRIYMIFFMEYDQAVNYLCEYVSESQINLVEKIDDKFKRKSIDKLSIIAEQKEGISKMNFSSDDEESPRVWPFRNLYKTVLLLLPNLCLLTLLYSQVLLYKNYFSAFMCLWIVAIFFYSVKFIEKLQVFTAKMKKVIKVYFLVAFVTTCMSCSHVRLDLKIIDTSWLRLGVFFLFFGFIYFMYLVEHVNEEDTCLYLISRTFRVTFMQARCFEALQYWIVKSQFVSQLGSQIHNQKKLLKLQKFYVGKQKISRRVQKLITQIQGKGKHTLSRNLSLTQLDAIDHIMDQNQQPKYQLYSNMLLILSLEDLKHCLQLMNHYYRPCYRQKHKLLPKSNRNEQSFSQISQSMTAEMRQIRANVLNIYHGSIYTAFVQYKRSLKHELREKLIQSSKLKSNENLPSLVKNFSGRDGCDRQSDTSSSSDQYVTIEKTQNMNLMYDKCIERIHHKSMEIPWVWRKFIQNSQIISMVVVTGWNFFGGIYAIPANFAIFAWALVLQTKTTVNLWSFFLLYSGLIIIIKFILPQLPPIPILDFIFYYYPNSCFYQLIIIVVSSIQIFLIKLGGTQYVSYSERESIYDAFYRKSLNKAAHKIESQLEREFVEVYKILSQPSKHSFFYRVFSKSRLKPGKDFYPLMSAIQLLILLFIFFFYDMMEFESRNNRKSLGEILTVNQFSKNMMIVLFTQVIIMVLDRCIVSLNFIDVKSQGLENFLLNFAFSDVIKYRAPEDVTHVGFFDFLLILKYLFHMLLLAVVNFFVYFYIPSSGFQKSLIPQCQNAECGKSYTFLSIFLLLYLAYFVVSGLQIKHGFSRDKCKNRLMEKHHWVNYYVYVLFSGIPFLWEFKKISDWTITTTALPLFHWLKFQDINARLYQSKCEAEMLKIKPRAKTPWTKYLLGPTGCLFILGLVFSPLLIYSSLNPFAVKDSVLASQVKLNLLVNGSVQYKFFSTSHSFITQDKSKISQTYRDEFDRSESIKSFLDFEDNNDFYLKMSSYPDENFKISEPAVEKLCARIDRVLMGKRYRFFDMVLHAKVIEKEGGENQIEWAKKRLTPQQLRKFKQFILPQSQPIGNTTTNATITPTPPTPPPRTFTLQSFYSPIPSTIPNKTICLLTRNNGLYYQLYTPDKSTNNCSLLTQTQSSETPGILLFYSSSTKYKIGFGLVTFYVTYVLLISRLFRVYLTGNLDNVIYEGCNLERMLVLCDAVRQARILENLYQEEYLYAFLVDLMRNPRTLKSMSGDFTDLRAKLPLDNK